MTAGVFQLANAAGFLVDKPFNAGPHADNGRKRHHLDVEVEAPCQLFALIVVRMSSCDLTRDELSRLKVERAGRHG